jgi:hypothetical protein
MSEAQAKRQLRQMLRSLTAGSVLHLLSELFAESARRQNDETARKQAQEVAATLLVVGLGVDAVCPR